MGGGGDFVWKRVIHGTGKTTLTGQLARNTTRAGFGSGTPDGQHAQLFQPRPVMRLGSVSKLAPSRGEPVRLPAGALRFATDGTIAVIDAPADENMTWRFFDSFDFLLVVFSGH
jgi:hypothetical protein